MRLRHSKVHHKVFFFICFFFFYSIFFMVFRVKLTFDRIQIIAVEQRQSKARRQIFKLTSNLKVQWQHAAANLCEQAI